ncbi:MAG: EAL domain-containing protein, partial [Lachnospiraceae bacterium]|nr:EAL domain-containing protein [Lachnospiraceae bacterium]
MNTNKYLTALENSISKLHQLPAPDPEQIFEAMADLCNVLRLGKVEVLIYENEASEHLGLSETNCFYDSGKACKNIGISKRITVVDGKIIVYNIYAMEGETEWSEEERNRINIFIATLSTYSGKARLIKLAHHMIFYDSELDMYNLKQFMKCVHTLCKTGQINRYTAVRFNFKRFSVVNQNIGRERGTLVMKKFIDFIDNLFDDENEFTCRVGGDNFLTLIKTDKLQSILDILNGISIIYDENRNERIFIDATVGVYVMEDIDGVILPTDIMDRVSLAFHLAKNTSQTDIVYFDDNLLARREHYNDISTNFPKALEEREFLVYYQPKVAIDGGHIAGAEALCRWIHNGRMVAPGEFIPILEQGLDICKLDFYMLDTVCKDIRRWLDSGMNVVRISVNLSRRHLSDIDL